MKARVKRIKWDIDKRGYIQPILILSKPLEIENQKFDSLVMNYKDVTEMSLGPNSEFYLKVVDGLMLDISHVTKQSLVKLPKGCPACGHDIDENKCTNKLCNGKGRTPIYKLFRYQFPIAWGYEGTFERLNNYLDNFPINFEETVRIEDYIDFLSCFSRSGFKDTNVRYSILKEKLAKTDLIPTSEIALKMDENYSSLDIEMISTFEMELEKRLTISIDEEMDKTLGLPLHIFWDSLSLLNIRSDDYEILKNLNPLSKDLILEAKVMGVSKSGVDKLKTLDPLLARVLSFFKISTRYQSTTAH